VGGTVCLIIIRGNKTQANARSLATEQIIEAASPQQVSTGIILMEDVAEKLSAINHLKLQFHDTSAEEQSLLVATRFTIAAAAAVCDAAYEFLEPDEQDLATNLMQDFNEATDALLLDIVANDS
jgi:hypothetical protein